MASPSHPLLGFRAALTDEAREWFDGARARAAATPRSLPEVFPQLPRRVGRGTFATGETRIDGVKLLLGAWRACDAAAFALLGDAGVSDETLLDLYQHGDMEERAMVLRAANCRPITDATVALLGEAQRTNTAHHFEAAVCDSNLLVRTYQHAGFGREGFNRAMLKLAFLDLPLVRVLDACEQANPDLSRMVQDLATEREAAGRRVWRDTNLLIAHAPTDGSLARIAGGLEHGDDAHRLAAARGLFFVRDLALLSFAKERLDREQVPAIQQALRAALDSAR